MTEEQLNLLRTSLDKTFAKSGEVGLLFYRRLFELVPDARPLFTADMPEQGRKFMATLASVINGLEHVPSMAPAVRNLGRRHAGYGVAAEHYPPVGEALIWALGEGLGDEFTPEMRLAWEKAYDLLSEIMLDAPPLGRRE
ncbi:globin family protein [Ancylobacter terrae]|uniref:globin family protein n=1 Tax=Ancylobacter sp. sgz301288 TaxID=3342077 RepID=UPI00385A26B9